MLNKETISKSLQNKIQVEKKDMNDAIAEVLVEAITRDFDLQKDLGSQVDGFKIHPKDLLNSEGASTDLVSLYDVANLAFRKASSKDLVASSGLISKEGHVASADTAITAGDSDTLDGFHAADLLAAGGFPTSAAGLVGMWTSDGMKEYPDNAAGTTYFQDAWATVGDFGTVNAALSIDNANIKVTTTVPTYITSFLSVNPNTKTVKARILDPLGKITALQYYDGSSYQNAKFSKNGNTLYLDQLYVTSSTRCYIRVGGSTIVSGDYIIIDWIYIGDGTYSTTARDISGQGKHGTVFGATPLADGGFSFDGVNDYIDFGDIAKYTGAITLSCRVKANSSITSGILGIIGKYKTPGNNRQYLLDLNNGKFRFLVSQDGTSAVVVEDTGTVISQSNYESIVAVYIPSTGLYLYRNGILVASNTTSIPASLYNGTASFDIARSLTGSLYSNISVVNPRIYNRALTDAEVLALSQNPNAGPIIAERIFTQDIEVGDGGAIYYFTDTGANRRAIKIGANAIEWGNFPEGGAFDSVGSFTRTDTSNNVVIDGHFTTEVSAGGGGSTPFQARIGAGIIESGVAPDGSRWQVFSDGTCHIEMTVAITGTAPAFGVISSYNNKTVTFPIELSDTTYRVFTTGVGNYGAWMQSEIDNTKTTTSMTGTAFNNCNAAATYSETSKLKILIIGRKV